MTTPFHVKLWAHSLRLARHDGVNAISRSIGNARVDLNPHQVDAALFALRSPYSKGVLLADEVGLGKTIEVWPGNVRELGNPLRRAAIWSDGAAIQVEAVREALLPVATATHPEVLNRPLGEGFNLADLLKDVARHDLGRAMDEAHGNKTKAADLVGLPSYQTLTNWLTKYEVDG